MSNNTIVVTRYNNSILYMYKDEKQPIEYQLFSDEQDIIGNIYSCEIKDIVSNIEASFVNCGNGNKGFFKSTAYKCGTILPLQLKKAGSNDKAPVYTDKLSISGMYVVVTNEHKNFAISKKINNPTKDELRNLYSGFFSDLEYGITLRTNSAYASMKDVLMEADELAGKLDDICQHGASRTCGSILYSQDNELVKYCLSVNPNTLKDIVTDDKELYAIIESSVLPRLRVINPDIVLKLYDDKMLSLNRFYSIETGLKEAQNKKVWLKSGGFLYIEPTEALVSIDVNTGKMSNGKDIQENFLTCNLEATAEICRQLRLRNLSGMIIIDYINMKDENNTKKVLDYLKELIGHDNVKTTFHDITALSLVELTRKKERQPLKDQLKGIEDKNV